MPASIFYETEILARESTGESGARPVRGSWRWGCSAHPASVSLDILVILIFTILLLVMYFILISHNFVTYVREIISGRGEDEVRGLSRKRFR